MLLPAAVYILFFATVLATYAFVSKATVQMRGLTLGIVFTWLLIQGFIGFTGFYTVTQTLPPRFLLLVGIPVLGIFYFFATSGGKRYLDSLNTSWLTVLHLVRVPVEVVLYLLFLNGQVPELMTFEGRNFDIFSGISAPFVWYFGYVRKSLSPGILIAWNTICLLLLFNIVINAVLSVQTPFQQFAFDQPNVAVLHFPFVWLPGFIVPVVLVSHLVCIRRLLIKTPFQENIN